MFLRIQIIAYALIFIGFFAGPAYSLNERIDVSQSASGEIVAQLSGMLYPCTVSLKSTSVVQPVPNEFEITTTAYDLLCPSMPDDLPFPYSLNADLGLLPDGKYTINWKFIFPYENETLPVASQTFVIKAGLLVSSTVSVPTMDAWGTIVFMVLAGLVATYRLRRMNQQS